VVTFFAIPEGSAAYQLNTFGEQSHLQILYNFEDMKPVRTKAIEGSLDPFVALDRMIEGTDIRYEFTNMRTVTLTLVNREQPYRIYDGWAYGCVPLDMVAGMLLTRKSDWLAYRIGLGLGLISKDTEWCTANRPIKEGEQATAPLIDEELHIASKRKRPPFRWGPRG
jgi:hypothetical protein